MIKWVKENFKKIRTEIIVSLFTAFCVNWINKMVYAAPNIGNTIIITFSNFIYTNASMQYDSALTKSIVMAILGIFSGGVICQITEGFSISKKINDIQSKIKEIQDGKFEKNDKVDDEKIKEGKGWSDILEKQKKKIITLNFAFLLFCILFLLSFVSCSVVPYDIWNNYKRDIVLVRPYTDEKTIQLLESDWVRMRSKDDYDKIYVVIDGIKGQNNL